MKLKLAAFALAAALVSAGPVLAGDTSNMSVTATVLGTCKFNTTPALAFGTLDPASGGTATATSNVAFWCTKGSAYTVTPGQGANWDSGNSTRRVKQGTNYIAYALTPSSSSGTGTGKSTPITLTMSGSILGADYIDAEEGAYSDTVQFSITP